MGKRIIIKTKQGHVRLAQPEKPNAQASQEAYIDALMFAEREGYHGQKYSGEHFNEEEHADLKRFSDRIKFFEQMRKNDATVVAQLLKIEEPIIASNWSIVAGRAVALTPDEETALDPAQLTEQHVAIEVLRGCLLGEIFEYRCEQDWPQILREMFTAHSLGFAIFEMVAEDKVGPLGEWTCFREISWIHPRSIKKIQLNEFDQISAIIQDVNKAYYDKSGNLTTKTEERKIDAAKLFIYTPRKEGVNIEGRTFTRPVYSPTKRKQFLQRAQIVDAQRRAIGIPYVKLSSDSDLSNKNPAIQQAKRMRGGANHLMYIVTRGEEEVGYVDMKANVPDLVSMIHDQQFEIRGVHATEASGLGAAGAGGSQSLGETQDSRLDILIKAVKEDMRRALQRHLVESMTRWNWINIPIPQLSTPDNIKPNVEAVTRGKEAGLIKWGGKDEQHFRRMHELPLLSEQEVTIRDLRALLPELSGSGFGLRSLWDVLRDMVKHGAVIPDTAARIMEPFTGVGKWEDVARMELAFNPLPVIDVKAEPADAPKPTGATDNQEGKKNPPDENKAPNEVKLARSESEWLREPNEFERRYINLAAIDKLFEDATFDYVSELTRLRDDAVDEAISKATLGKHGEVAIKSLRSAAFTKSLNDLSEKFTEKARAQVKEELKKQANAGGTVELSRTINLAKHSDMFGKVRVETRVKSRQTTAIGISVEDILNQVVSDIRREYLKAIDAGDPDALETASRIAKSRNVSPQATAHVSRAVNGGRAIGAAEFSDEALPVDDDNPDVRFTVDVAERDEILDSATCARCEELDGLTVPVESEAFWEEMPPNHCAGGSRCRGIYIFKVVTYNAQGEEVA